MAERQGQDLNVPKFQQGIHSLIIWNIKRLQRHSVGSQTGNGVRVFVVSVTPPCSTGVPTENDGAIEK